MEEGTFRLLVFAAIAIALIALIFLLFPPLPESTETEKIEALFQGSEINVGKYSTEEILFSEGYYAKAEYFDTINRTVAFQCFDLSNCCEKEMLGKLCSKPVQWGSRFFLVTRQTKLKFSTRCREETFFICRGFIGLEPGQIEITEYSVEPQQTGKGEKISVNAKLRNSGGTDIIGVQGTILLLREKEGEKEKEEKRKISLEKFPLYLGKEVEVEKEIEVSEAGEYEVVIYFEEITDPTDYAEEKAYVEVSGEVTAGECNAGEKSIEWNADNETCIIRMECTDCANKEKCEGKWVERIPKLEGKEFSLSGFNTEEKTISVSVQGTVQGEECIPQ